MTGPRVRGTGAAGDTTGMKLHTRQESEGAPKDCLPTLDLPFCLHVPGFGLQSNEEGGLRWRWWWRWTARRRRQRRSHPEAISSQRCTRRRLRLSAHRLATPGSPADAAVCVSLPYIWSRTVHRPHTAGCASPPPPPPATDAGPCVASHCTRQIWIKGLIHLRVWPQSL